MRSSKRRTRRRVETSRWGGRCGIFHRFLEGLSRAEQLEMVQPDGHPF